MVFSVCAVTWETWEAWLGSIFSPFLRPICNISHNGLCPFLRHSLFQTRPLMLRFPPTSLTAPSPLLCSPQPLLVGGLRGAVLGPHLSAVYTPRSAHLVPASNQPHGSYSHTSSPASPPNPSGTTRTLQASPHGGLTGISVSPLQHQPPDFQPHKTSPHPGSPFRSVAARGFWWPTPKHGITFGSSFSLTPHI